VAEQLNSGAQWFARTEKALVAMARHMAEKRYGTAPDLPDRVGDAMLALAEAVNDFRPAHGQDSLGYFLQYVLAKVAGSMRHGAQEVKDSSDVEITFTDLDPEQLGIEYLLDRQDGPDEFGENLWVVRGGKVFDTLELIDAIAGHEKRAKVALHVMGCQEDDLRVNLLKALQDLAEQSPDWVFEPAPPEPVADFQDTVVVRHTEFGAVEEIVPAEEVALASKGNAPWIEEQFAVQYEPIWARDWEEQRLRPVGAMAADRRSWPKEVSRELWDQVRSLIVDFKLTTQDVIDHAKIEESVVYELADVLLYVDDEQAMTVVRAIARLTGAEGDEFDVLCDTFGLSSDEGWEPEEGGEDLGQRIESWLSRLPVVERRLEMARTNGLGCYKSQMAAIRALACDGASPYEAKQAARRAFGLG
jgi:hypothetical protein